MASKQAVASTLKALAANYSKALDPALPEVWFLAFQEVSDEALKAGVGKAVATLEFFPSVAGMRNVLGLNRKSPPNVTAICERIRGLCDYHPQYGTTLPSVERVRAELGDAVADAYGYIGPKRLEAVVFDGAGVGADIAGREFATALSEAQDAGADLTLLPPVARPMLSASGTTLYNVRPEQGFKRLTAGLTA